MNFTFNATIQDEGGESNSDEITDWEFYHEFEYYLRLTIHVLGLVGNLLMLVTYYSGSLRKMSISVYFRWVAVLCAYQNIDELARYFLHTSRLQNKWEILCRINSFLYLFLKPTSAWLEILAGLDRYLTIVYPYKFKFLKKRLAQFILVASVIVYNSACYAKVFVDSHVEIYDYAYSSEPGLLCQIFVFFDSSLIDLLNGAAIPFIVMGISSMLTFLGVRRSHAQIKSSIANESHRRRKLVHDIKFGVTMIVLNILFVLLNSPYRIYYIIEFTQPSYFRLSRTLESIFIILIELYYSMVFWVQVSVNSVVRKEIKMFFTRIWHKTIILR